MLTKNDDFLESHVLGKEHVEEDNNARRLRSEVVLNNRRGFAQCPESLIIGNFPCPSGYAGSVLE
jgi:hypothetical protein